MTMPTFRVFALGVLLNFLGSPSSDHTFQTIPDTPSARTFPYDSVAWSSEAFSNAAIHMENAVSSRPKTEEIRMLKVIKKQRVRNVLALREKVIGRLKRINRLRDESSPRLSGELPVVFKKAISRRRFSQAAVASVAAPSFINSGRQGGEGFTWVWELVETDEFVTLKTVGTNQLLAFGKFMSKTLEVNVPVAEFRSVEFWLSLISAEPSPERRDTALRSLTGVIKEELLSRSSSPTMRFLRTHAKDRLTGPYLEENYPGWVHSHVNANLLFGDHPGEAFTEKGLANLMNRLADPNDLGKKVLDHVNNEYPTLLPVESLADDETESLPRSAQGRARLADRPIEIGKQRTTDLNEPPHQYFETVPVNEGTKPIVVKSWWRRWFQHAAFKARRWLHLSAHWISQPDTISRRKSLPTKDHPEDPVRRHFLTAFTLRKDA